MKNKIVIFLLLLLNLNGFSQIVRTLPNVNNTSDTLKPVSSPQKVAINQKLHTVASKTALVAFSDASFAYFDGSTWEKKSGSLASNGGAFAGTIVNVSASFYWERVYQSVTPQMFGAIADDGIDDITAFNNMTIFAKSKANPIKIIIPQGKYTLNNIWIIDGNAQIKAPNVEGIGNVVLDFSSTVSTTSCIQFGSPATNTLYGSLKNITIQGKSTVDGLTISSASPYACAFNNFENISIFNVRDGLNFASNTTTVSNFSNSFTGLFKVEKYFRFAVKSDGSYNDFNHLFLVQPSGETSVTSPNTSLGSLTLALYDVGGNNTFRTVETEDQIVLNGGFCKIQNLSMEHIVKGQPYGGNKVALNINGSNVEIANLWMIEFNNTIIEQLINVAGINISLKNIKYENSTANALFNILYGVLPNNGSGIIENCDAFASYLPDNPAFASQVTNWNFINCNGTFGAFNKFSNVGKFTVNGLKLGDANNINSSSILELQSTSKGVLISRMTQAQRNAISSPATWLQLICTDCIATDASTGVLQIFNGTVWKNAY